MASTQITQTLQVFTDLTGQPLDAGYIYIGQENQNPETSQIAVYWDAALTQPAAQPLRTIGGYISRQGTPADVYAASGFSMTVKTKNGELVYYQPTPATDSPLRLELAASGGSALVGFTQSGTGATSRTVQEKLRDMVSVKDFGVVGGLVADEASAFNNAATYAASINAELDLCGLSILYGGGFTCSTPGAKVMWRNGKLKLTSGAKTSGAAVVSGIDTVSLANLALDGNRANVSGNNAGFFVIDGVRNVDARNIHISDLRRYGINIGGYTGCGHVNIEGVTADNVGVNGSALGEAIMVQNSTNVTIDGVKIDNTSGTGDGQVVKVFNCQNVKATNFQLSNVGPSKVYPAMSFVRNNGLTYSNIKVSGSCQVALEDNANVGVTYNNIETSGTDKALIASTDGAGFGDRYSEDIIINGWRDTSTTAQAFNINGCKGLTLRNVTTPWLINISRDDPGTNRRTEDLLLERVTCANLNTLLVEGTKRMVDVSVSGTYTNTSAGATEFVSGSYGAYTNSAVSGVFLIRSQPGDDAIHVRGTLAATTGTLDYLAPSNIANAPFMGEVLASSWFESSGANQWSQIRWTFYDYGTPTVNKAVVQTGTTARSNVALTVSRGTRKLSFANTEGVQIELSARIHFINANSSAT